ncbi:hypothetical protein HF086_005363, partial [Spodoptera exigua]
MLLDTTEYVFCKIHFKRPCSNITVECNWRSKTFNCSEMFHPLLTIVGHCCQFDMPYFIDECFPWNKNTDSLELKLYVYDYKEKITLVDSFFSLTPQSFFDVNIYVWAIDSSSYVKALPLSGRKCILDT